MAFLEVKNVVVRGMAVAVPRTCEQNSDIYSRWSGYENFVATTGIERRRVVDDSLCSSDLCVSAAERLMADMNWGKDDIDALIFVSQSPDYILPATSNIIQTKLGLKESCFVLDISLGCSGWVYAMMVLSSIMQNGTIKRGLVLAGDTISKFCSTDDKSTYPLFGDAGTVTALEWQENVTPIRFCMNSDGKGYETIIIRDGGYRNVATPDSFVKVDVDEGIVRSRLNLELDGMSVFSFGISKAPQVVKQLADNYSIDLENVDMFTFHQANMFMNEKIRKKLKLPVDKVPYSLRDYGNTSCASIPLTLVTQRAEVLRNNKISHIACGFGVGLSWGAVAFNTDNLVVSDIIEL